MLRVNESAAIEETSMRTQVLVVGAGPVGLTAAMDLASRGIEVVVAARAELQRLRVG